MKKILTLSNSILVVEGKSDKTFLSSFIETEFFITNGSDLNVDKIDYLKKVQKTGKKIFVLTDPDFPGEKIRKEINQKIPSSINVFVPKEKCIKRNKLGVAESDKDTILKAFENVCVPKGKSLEKIKVKDLFELNLSGSENSNKMRKEICHRLGIGFCNTKTMISRMYNCGIGLEDLKEEILKYDRERIV